MGLATEADRKSAHSPGPVSRKRSPWAWIPSLYFAEGIPYVVVMTVSVIMYKRLGVSNTEIALYTSWLYLPWVIKPLWSPLVDVLKTKFGSLRRLDPAHKEILLGSIDVYACLLDLSNCCQSFRVLSGRSTRSGTATSQETQSASLPERAAKPYATRR